MSRRIMIGVAALTVALLPAATARADVPAGFTETLIASAMPAPTAMAIAPDGRIFVTQQGAPPPQQQPGQVRVVKNGALEPVPFVTIPVNAEGERGLLGVAFDPNFGTTNQFVYVYYTTSTAPIHNRVSRFTASGDVAVPGSELAILNLENLSATNHNGGALHFGPDGKLYVAVGENAVPNNAQLLTNRLGKMLRINSNGTIPTDNPYSNDPTVTGDNKAIWAHGLRNPFTFAFQPGTGRMFINDVGSGGANPFEEINDGIARSNYGWPTCEGPCVPPNSNFRDPFYWYGHNPIPGPTTGCAIVGGAFYNPAVPQFPPDFSGDYFFGDLCSGWIRRIDLATRQTFDFATAIATPVDVAVAADGSLYYLARGGGGSLYRVTRNPTSVLVGAFRAVRTPGGVVLRWRVVDPGRVLGFNVFRQRTRLNRGLIPARGSQAFTDRQAPSGRTAYRLEAKLVDGSRVWYGPVRAS